jgi:hypothetical protein
MGFVARFIKFTHNPVGCHVSETGGLLTCPGLPRLLGGAKPPMASCRKPYCRTSGAGLTAAGTVPESHGVPFSVSDAKL